MKKFKNNKTGNIVRVKNNETIDLMEKSDRYSADKGAAGKKSQQAD